MAGDPHNTSDISDQAEPTSAAKEDAETTAARRELKQTSISEKAGQGAMPLSQDDKSASEDDGPADKPTGRRITPEIDLGPPREDEGLREQVSSPKKKRAHDELDESRIEEGALDDTSATTATASQNRTDRSEPEKKRPRDGQEPLSGSTSPRSSAEQQPSDTKPAAATATSFKAEPPKQTSASAFAASGFAKLAASSTSPFGSFGGGGNSPNKPSLFGSTAPSLAPSSVFGGGASNPATTSSSTSTAPAPPKFTFGGGSGASSPFASAGLNGSGAATSSGSGSVFGGGAGARAGGFGGAGAGGAGGSSVFKSSAASSPFASAFGGSALSGPRLTSFGGKPGEALKSGKPARPFGAPESEDEGDEDGGDGEGEGEGEEAGSNAGGEGDEDGASDEEGRGGDGKGGSGSKEEEGRGEEGRGEDRKKPRLQKIVVDDGEGQEVTLFSVRAKMYVMEKGVGWKERGGGMLKVNVPKATVELDDQTGQADPASFDPSVLDDEDDDQDDHDDEEAQSGEKQQGESASRRHVRLIMRQDHTLRVILNTIILPAMKFQVTNRLKTSTVLFTAFEGNEVRQVQMKMSEVNATSFSHLVEMLKKRLADV